MTDSPGWNAFVARLDSSGQQIRFSTLLGGAGGAVATAVETDAFANTYLAGSTSSNDFPTTPGAAQTALNPGYQLQGFLAKFDPGGKLLWSTLTPSEVSSIAVDGDGSVVVLSQYGIQRVSPSGDRIDAIPSSALNYTSILISVALAPNGNIAVVGETRLAFSFGPPSYLIWMDPFGSTISKTTFESSSVSAVEVDASGTAVIAGATLSEVGGTPGAWQSAPLGGCPYGPSGRAAFVARISQAGGIISSTLLGGQCGDSANTLALASDGDAIVTGTAGSPAFPVLNPLEAGPVLGGYKGFLARVSADARTLRFSTFLSFTETPWYSVAAPPSGPIVLVNANTSTLTFLTLPSPTPIVVTAVGNALHNNNAAVTAGEIAFVSASGLGEDAIGTGMDLHRAPVPELNGVRVYFGDEQADIMGIGPSTVYFRVPPDAASSGAADLRVEYNGVSSNPIRVQTVPADPGLLSADGSGRGQANARNEDGASNTPDNPARVGSVIRLYFTGANPALGSALLVRAGGETLKVLSAEQVQGFFPGLSEVFVQVDVPGEVPVTLSAPVSFLIGAYSQMPVSPPLTISVR